MKEKIFLFIFGLYILVACTYSITMVHTTGQASDVVDEVQSNKPDVKTDLSLPG